MSEIGQLIRCMSVTIDHLDVVDHRQDEMETGGGGGGGGRLCLFVRAKVLTTLICITNNRVT